MSPFGAARNFQPPHRDPTVINTSEGHAFDHDGGPNACCQFLINGANPIQITHALFAAVGDKPDIRWKLLVTEQFSQHKNRCNAQTIVTQPRSIDASIFATCIQDSISLKHGIGMSADQYSG